MRVRTRITHFAMLRGGKQFCYLPEEAGIIILAASVLDSNNLRYHNHKMHRKLCSTSPWGQGQTDSIFQYLSGYFAYLQEF